MLSSANIRFKREFSSSRSLNRLTSDASRPTYFEFHLKKVTSETDSSMEISLNGIPDSCFFLKQLQSVPP